MRDYIDFSYEAESALLQCNVDKSSTLNEIERLKTEAGKADE